MPEAKTKTLVLPPEIVSQIDIGRLQRELAETDEFLTQAEVRKGGEAIEPPKTTQTLDNLAKTNDLNLLKPEGRKQLKEFLDAIRTDAPVVHISFAADPSPAFLKKISAWFRSEIHPLVLLQVGLQPGIAAGCIVRTSNKYFDFSLRKRFESNQKMLISNLVGAEAGGE